METTSELARTGPGEHTAGGKGAAMLAEGIAGTQARLGRQHGIPQNSMFPQRGGGRRVSTHRQKQAAMVGRKSGVRISQAGQWRVMVPRTLFILVPRVPGGCGLR